eukprot:GILJ01009115.1.p1 GENE.GILJ01009115.1~~GILJ01009115.1.p1  ORF type:complete len:723 (-),score=96.78 GILJ01009115.1:229-2397(-)
MATSKRDWRQELELFDDCVLIGSTIDPKIKVNVLYGDKLVTTVEMNEEWDRVSSIWSVSTSQNKDTSMEVQLLSFLPHLPFSKVTTDQADGSLVCHARDGKTVCWELSADMVKMWVDGLVNQPCPCPDNLGYVVCPAVDLALCRAFQVSDIIVHRVEDRVFRSFVDDPTPVGWWNITNMLSSDVYERILQMIMLGNNVDAAHASVAFMQSSSAMANFPPAFWSRLERAVVRSSVEFSDDEILLTLQEVIGKGIRVPSVGTSTVIGKREQRFVAPDYKAVDVANEHRFPTPPTPFGSDFDWTNIVLAGGYLSRWAKWTPSDGFVVRQSMDLGVCDLDLFVVGDNIDDVECQDILRRIAAYLQKLTPDQPVVWATKTPHVVELYQGPRCVQVVANGARSIHELLMSFDMPHCKMAFDGTRIWCTWTAVQALQNNQTWHELESFPVHLWRLFKPTTHGYDVVARPSGIHYVLASPPPSTSSSPSSQTDKDKEHVVDLGEYDDDVRERYQKLLNDNKRLDLNSRSFGQQQFEASVRPHLVFKDEIFTDKSSRHNFTKWNVVERLIGYPCFWGANAENMARLTPAQVGFNSGYGTDVTDQTRPEYFATLRPIEGSRKNNVAAVATSPWFIERRAVASATNMAIRQYIEWLVVRSPSKLLPAGIYYGGNIDTIEIDSETINVKLSGLQKPDDWVNAPPPGYTRYYRLLHNTVDPFDKITSVSLEYVDV